MSTGDQSCPIHGFLHCDCYVVNYQVPNEFAYFDEYPKEDPFKSLASKDEVVEKLQQAITDYLSFCTTRDLIKLVADLL